MEAAQRLLSAGIPVVAWIGPDAEGCAIIDCYSSAPLAMESAACGAWTLKALGGWDASARMTFYVTHIADCVRDESSAVVHTHASAWLSAVGGRSTGAWSVAIRRARCGFNALHELIRRQGSCALIAADVDWAIYFNDAYGHHEGDLMLARVHTVIEQLAEEYGGHFVRTGGDDFAIVLPENTSSDPMACAESIRASVHDLNIPLHHPAVRTHGRVTVSVCVLRRRTLPATATELREAVEDAIYEAKRLGKNNVRELGPG
jgi:diguanylate cyclase (GGDEF)-like protein